jgi:hypothetical protein
MGRGWLGSHLAIGPRGWICRGTKVRGKAYAFIEMEESIIAQKEQTFYIVAVVSRW